MTILVTGAAGFIGSSVCRALLARGEAVVGVDNLNDYYEISLKQARLDTLAPHKNFIFRKADISDRDAMLALAGELPDITGIINLAAQAGVRYSLANPYVYITSNVMGQVVMLEMARLFSGLKHFVYASSSSVYGSNEKMPFSVDDPVERPSSLYAATKRADELIGHTYAHLYGVPATGLRLFTVYGPWGRPDMAPILFTRDILKNRPIRVFNHGEMWRDFTYIDDVVNGIVRTLDRPASGTPPHKVYNIGNNISEKLTDFINEIEKALGLKANCLFEPLQPGDVVSSYADIDASRRDLGFEPTTPISVGIPKFIAWYREFYDV
ncbi:MAG: NAD-dependent epimerase/dehydratase family protein [Alphaproteobacteria bacterium]|nr:NAD-dependent epimerase/dehydratase family protein [Alphaproteobacteria bacterium]